jgi:hypothetical protein
MSSNPAPCPICNTVPQTRTHRPFCSQRCADIDLGRWLRGSYAIPGEPLDQTEEAPPGPRSGED